MQPACDVSDRHAAPRRRRSSGAALLAAMLVAGCALTKLPTSARLARQVEPLQAAPADPAWRLLIVGDSTGVGVGASAAEHSVAGLIARDHPDWRIDNRSANSARIADVVRQLGRGGRYDAVLVMAGGTDVIRLTGAEALRESAFEAARAAAAIAPHVVWMPCGNVGHAPFFHAPWSWAMSAWTRELYRDLRAAAGATGAEVVDLYDGSDADPFLREPGRLLSADTLHPSDAGYAEWYRRLVEQSGVFSGNGVPPR